MFISGSLQREQPSGQVAGKSDDSADAVGSATADDQQRSTGEQDQQATSSASASSVQVSCTAGDVAQQMGMLLSTALADIITRSVGTALLSCASPPAGVRGRPECEDRLQRRQLLDAALRQLLWHRQLHQREGHHRLQGALLGCLSRCQAGPPELPSELCWQKGREFPLA